MHNLLKSFIYICLLSFLYSCSMFEYRDYSDQMDPFMGYSDEPMFMPNKDFMVVAGDSGRDYRSFEEIKRRTPASYNERLDDRYQKSLQVELNAHVNRLSDEEYWEYDKIKNKLGSTSEKIYYLGLNPREKKQYLNARGIQRSYGVDTRAAQKQDLNHFNRVALYPKDSVQAPNYPRNDVVMGMDMDTVVGTWGEPQRRDIAGNPTNRNERWAFRRDGKTKFIYFEQGRVQGWSEAE